MLIDHRRWKKENNFIVESPTYLMENERKSPGGKKTNRHAGDSECQDVHAFTQELVPVSLAIVFLSISSVLGVSFLPDLADSDVLPERRHLSGRRLVVSQ